MLSSSIRTAMDADELHAALRPASGVLTVTAAGVFQAEVVRIDLLKLKMQHARETAPRGWHLTQVTDRAGLCFLTQRGPSVVFQGNQLDETTLALVPAGGALWQSLTGPANWGSMSLALEDWEVLNTLAGADVMPGQGKSAVVTNRQAMTALTRRQLAAVHLAETAPELLTNRDVARGLEQSLIHAIADCLCAPAATKTTRRQRVKVMARFSEVLEQRVSEPIYIPELCTELGVAERTLRECCAEFLGVSPKKYLALRRMHLARRALLDNHAISVTDVATSLGFWELGRFAVAYRNLFGEMPSQTLHNGRKL